jgi:hypothetical protein
MVDPCNGRCITLYVSSVAVPDVVVAMTPEAIVKRTLTAAANRLRSADRAMEGIIVDAIRNESQGNLCDRGTRTCVVRWRTACIRMREEKTSDQSGAWGRR